MPMLREVGAAIPFTTHIWGYGLPPPVRNCALGGDDGEGACRAPSHFARYAAKNIRVALSTTSSMRLAEGAGAAWKTNGRNSVALHISMNCDAASWQSSIARS